MANQRGRRSCRRLDLEFCHVLGFHLAPSVVARFPRAEFPNLARMYTRNSMTRISAGIARICSPFGAGIASAFRRWFFFALLAVITVYYLFLLSNGTFQIFAPEMLDKVFNSMLVNLFHGDFTVDPKAIGFE